MSRDVHSCTHWLRPRNPLNPSAFGLVYEGAIGQLRQTTSLCNPLLPGFTEVFKVYRIHYSHTLAHNSPSPLYTTREALQKKSDLCFPRIQTARPRSRFLYSYICERFIYSQARSAYFAAARLADRSWKYINSSQIYECRNWEWGRAVLFLGIYFFPNFRYDVFAERGRNIRKRIIVMKQIDSFLAFFRIKVLWVS